MAKKANKSETITNRIVDYLFKLVPLATGYVKTQVRYQESARGGVNPQLAEAPVKRWLDKLRKDVNTSAGTTLTLVQFCEMFITKFNDFDKFYTFYYKGDGTRVEIDQRLRDIRIHALSNRVKNGFCPLLNITEHGDANLSKEQLMSIIRGAAEMFIRVTNPYVPPVRKVQVVKATDAKKKAAPKSKARGKGKSAPKGKGKSAPAPTAPAA